MLSRRNFDCSHRVVGSKNLRRSAVDGRAPSGIVIIAQHQHAVSRVIGNNYNPASVFSDDACQAGAMSLGLNRQDFRASGRRSGIDFNNRLSRGMKLRRTHCSQRLSGTTDFDQAAREKRSLHCALVFVERYTLCSTKQLISGYRSSRFMSHNISYVQKVEERRLALIKDNVTQIRLRLYQRRKFTIPFWKLLVFSGHRRYLVRQQRVRRRDYFFSPAGRTTAIRLQLRGHDQHATRWKRLQEIRYFRLRKDA